MKTITIKLHPIFVLLTLIFGTHSMAQTTVAGKTLVARGPVQAISPDSNEFRKLKRRSVVYGEDTVSTGDKGKAQLRMTDGGMIALKQNSELLISDYQYSEQTERGSVVMNLVKGGLRSVTGAIKAESGDYKLKTPVGSIGIRGTHYEVEIVGSTLWVAVWDGAVDLEITRGSQAGSTLSLGADEGFSYASIDDSGGVTTYVEPPETFESGMTTEADEVDQQDEAEEEETEQSSTSQSSLVATSTVAVRVTTEQDSSVVEAQDEAETVADVEDSNATATAQEKELEVPEESLTSANDEFNIPDASIEELLEQRSGTFTYNSVEAELESTAGPVSNFQMAITVDFENAAVPGGNMSFNDDGGEWFATFDGNIVAAGLDLEFSKVTHGDQLGDGSIEASFFGDLDTIWGSFTLEENVNPEINVSGSFRIK